ncbi:MAG TPA: ABC transporter permease [Elusimicrobiales bacterium]|nr:ABC transporter permease [Elusimicrobiales bacterium]
MRHPVSSRVGEQVLGLAGELGTAALMLKSTVFWFFKSRLELRETMKQSVKIGVDSLGVTALTSFFTGMVLALQTGHTSKNLFNERFGITKYRV